jgi:hypothetical protein
VIDIIADAIVGNMADPPNYLLAQLASHVVGLHEISVDPEGHGPLSTGVTVDAPFYVTVGTSRSHGSSKRSIGGCHCRQAALTG